MKRFIATALLLLLAGQASAASCWVSEFSNVTRLLGGQPLNIAQIEGSNPTTQSVTATTPTAITNAFAQGARFIWVYCDEAMFIQFGTSPTTGMATAHGNGTLMIIPAGGFWLDLPSTVTTTALKIAFCDADCA